MRDAVVISGGAALLFWQAGAVARLLERGLAPERWCGTSAGALVATLAAAGQVERVRDLAKQLTGRQLFPPPRLGALGYWRRFKHRGGLLDPRPLRKLIARELADDVLDAIPGGALEVAAFSYRRGVTEYFSPETCSPAEFRAAVLSSASIPFAFPPVVLKVPWLGYAAQYADGGVLDNFPVERLVSRVLTERLPETLAERASAAAGDWRLLIVSATQTYPVGPLPEPGSIRWLQEALGRLTAAALHHDARLSREYAERFGFMGRRLVWLQAPELRLELPSFTSAQAVQAYELGRASAATVALSSAMA
ncbi:MAG: patatin-like phospholipase family protein [Planctomycetota bacterium]